MADIEPIYRERRKLDEEQIKMILDIVREHALTIDAKEHQYHHQFISEMLEEKKRKRELWDKVREQVAGWAIIAALGAVGSLVYNFFIHSKDHIK